MTEAEKEILLFCIKYALSEELSSRPKQVDQFVMDNVFVFTQKKTKIDLKLYDVEQLDISLQNIPYRNMKHSKYSTLDRGGWFLCNKSSYKMKQMIVGDQIKRMKSVIRRILVSPIPCVYLK